MLRFMGSLRVGHDCTELNWTNPKKKRKREPSRVARLRESQHVGSAVLAHGLSCSAAGAIFLDQGLSEPTSPALAGGFSSTALLGKSSFFFNLKNFLVATLNNSMSLHYIFLGKVPLRHWGNFEEKLLGWCKRNCSFGLLILNHYN